MGHLEKPRFNKIIINKINMLHVKIYDFQRFFEVSDGNNRFETCSGLLSKENSTAKLNKKVEHTRSNEHVEFNLTRNAHFSESLNRF